jgi:hypothetical protein
MAAHESFSRLNKALPWQRRRSSLEDECLREIARPTTPRPPAPPINTKTDGSGIASTPLPNAIGRGNFFQTEDRTSRCLEERTIARFSCLRKADGQVLKPARHQDPGFNPGQTTEENYAAIITFLFGTARAATLRSLSKRSRFSAAGT